MLFNQLQAERFVYDSHPISYVYACGKLTGTFAVLGVLSSNTPTLNYTLSIPLLS